MAHGAPAPEELDVTVIRAGAAPGMHLVGFDAPGESLEMRLTARDRSAYASGAVTAAEWLTAEPRSSGFHTFDEVLDSIIAKQNANKR
jgi:4-hydroxy-tetrahydrodipicolinate reductase